MSGPTESRSSLNYWQQLVEPCGAKTGNAELLSCLILVAPTGMMADERNAWLQIARRELSGMPEDLLKRGCAAARRTVDHPSKIIPAIMKESEADWRERQRLANAPRHTYTAEALPPPPKHVMDRRGEPMTAAETAELNRILAWAGAKFRYREDGSRYEASAEETAAPPIDGKMRAAGE